MSYCPAAPVSTYRRRLKRRKSVTVVRKFYYYPRTPTNAWEMYNYRRTPYRRHLAMVAAKKRGGTMRVESNQVIVRHVSLEDVSLQPFISRRTFW
jgi:hypothetical protein